MKLLFFSALLIFGLTACSTTKTNEFSLFSMDKEVGLRLKRQHAEAKEVSFEHCNRQVFFIDTNTHMSEQQIVEAALIQSPGANVLTDSGSHMGLFIIPFFIYDSVCLKIYGSAVKI